MLSDLRAAPVTTRADLIGAFLAPPVLSRDFDRPAWAQRLDAFEEGARDIPG